LQSVGAEFVSLLRCLTESTTAGHETSGDDRTPKHRE
jgi:hypothetical protein